MKKHVAVVDEITVEGVGSVATVMEEADEVFFVKEKERVSVDDGC